MKGKHRRTLIKRILPAVIACGLCFTTTVYADTENSYVYDNNGKPVTEPLSYISDGRITGEDLGVGSFKSPKDVFVYNDEIIYIVDTGNNRIIELASDYKLIRVIDSFSNNGVPDSFNSPNAVFRSGDIIYVADTANARIVLLDSSLNVKAIYGKPESKLITEDFAYEPIDIVADSAGRMFIVSKSVNDGIIELSEEGEFVGFIGSVKAQLTIFEKIWRAIASEAQREKMQLSLPTEHSSVDIDESGFIYTTVSAINEDNYSPETFVSRLNPMGKDVLKRNGYAAPMGDVELDVDDTYQKQYSALVDVAVRGDGIYSVLDQRKGRVFTYNSNGELMYIFGSLGNNEGQFGMPEALDTIDRDVFLIVDSTYNWVSIFKPTKYGDLVTRAVASFYNRNYDESDELWEEALKYTSQSKMAFDGLGRSYLKQEKNSEAMKYLKTADDRENYSTAFENFRGELISEHFTLLIVSLVGILIVSLVLHLIISRRRKAGK